MQYNAMYKFVGILDNIEGGVEILLVASCYRNSSLIGQLAHKQILPLL